LTTPTFELIDSITYVEAASDYSYGRFPDGSGEFSWCAAPTPNALNGASCGS
jgi:hypothetical protein